MTEGEDYQNETCSEHLGKAASSPINSPPIRLTQMDKGPSISSTGIDWKESIIGCPRPVPPSWVADCCFSQKWQSCYCSKHAL
ncbi:hypothetical protein NPIL_540921 [Nephila pilipes]|uniref:Uncharacterized protein n=1 Tax=Nephila pilipes TaxID=299642 RepID=A0A8X6PJ58_NEPPI|nr:hypothetical protein NPIL_540921 [Nephila pilipes]